MSLVGTRPPTVDEYEQYELGHRKFAYNGIPKCHMGGGKARY